MTSREERTPLDAVLLVLSLPVSVPALVSLWIGAKRWGRVPGLLWVLEGGLITVIVMAYARQLSPVMLVACVAGCALLFRRGDKSAGLMGMGLIAVLLIVAVAYALEAPDVTIDANTDDVQAIAITADGTRIATVSRTEDPALFSLETGDRVATYPVKLAGVQAIEFGLGGAELVAATDDGYLRAHDTEAETQKREAKIEGFRPTSPVVLSEDASLIAVGSEGGVQLYDTTEGTSLGSVGQLPSEVRVVAVAPDNQKLAAGDSRGNVGIWTRSEASSGPPTAHRSDVLAIAFSPDVGKLASSDAKRTLVWETTAGTQLLEIPFGGRALAFSEDGTRVFIGSDTEGAIVAIDAETGKETGRQRVPMSVHRRIRAIAARGGQVAIA